MPDQYEIGVQDGEVAFRAPSEQKSVAIPEHILSLDERNREIEKGNGQNFSKIAETEIKCHKKKI